MTVSLKAALTQMISDEINAQTVAEALVERIFSTGPIRIPNLTELRYHIRKHPIPGQDENHIGLICPGTLIQATAILDGVGKNPLPPGIKGKIVEVWMDLEGRPLDTCCYCGRDLAPSIRNLTVNEERGMMPTEQASPLPILDDADPLKRVRTDIALAHLIHCTASYTMQLVEVVKVASRNEWRDHRGRAWGWELAIKNIEEALQAARAFGPDGESSMLGRLRRISRQKDCRDLYLKLLEEATPETGGN